MAYGNPARWYKINELGMKRGGLSQEIIDFVKGFYKNYSDFDRDASKISNKFIRDIFREYYKKIGSEKEVPYGGSY